MKKIVAILIASLIFAGGSALAKNVSGDISSPVGDLSLGGTISFPYVTEGINGRSATYTEIAVHCYQNGEKVLGDTKFANGNSFLLGGDFWSPWLENGGAADCIAQLFYFDNKDAVVVLDSVDFSVDS